METPCRDTMCRSTRWWTTRRGLQPAGIWRFRTKTRRSCWSASKPNAFAIAVWHRAGEPDERSRRIIEARWLTEGATATLHELAAEYGVSAERIRQIEHAHCKKCASRSPSDPISRRPAVSIIQAPTPEYSRCARLIPRNRAGLADIRRWVCACLGCAVSLPAAGSSMATDPTEFTAMAWWPRPALLASSLDTPASSPDLQHSKTQQSSLRIPLAGAAGHPPDGEASVAIPLFPRLPICRVAVLYLPGKHFGWDREAKQDYSFSKWRNNVSEPVWDTTAGGSITSCTPTGARAYYIRRGNAVWSGPRLSCIPPAIDNLGVWGRSAARTRIHPGSGGDARGRRARRRVHFFAAARAYPRQTRETRLGGQGHLVHHRSAGCAECGNRPFTGSENDIAPAAHRPAHARTGRRRRRRTLGYASLFTQYCAGMGPAI